PRTSAERESKLERHSKYRLDKGPSQFEDGLLDYRNKANPGEHVSTVQFWRRPDWPRQQQQHRSVVGVRASGFAKQRQRRAPRFRFGTCEVQICYLGGLRSGRMEDTAKAHHKSRVAV